MRKRFPQAVKLQIAAGQQWCCYACKQLLDPFFELDHRVALCLGGGNEYSNLGAICRDCHSNKTALEVVAFNRKEALHCYECGVYFSKYFITSHIHKRSS